MVTVTEMETDMENPSVSRRTTYISRWTTCVIPESAGWNWSDPCPQGKSNILYGSIYVHLKVQGIWGVISVATALFGARTRSIIYIIVSRINSLGSNKAGEEKGTATATATAP